MNIKTPTRGLEARPQRDPKTAAKMTKAVPIVWGGVAFSPKQLLIIAGSAVVLILIILLIYFGYLRKEMPMKSVLPTALSPGSVPGQPSTSLPSRSPEAAILRDRSLIRSVRFHPPQPTIMDTLKTEVLTTAPAEPGRITYAYAWKVNDRVVEGVTGDTLNLSALKKRDLIMVTVTPYDGDKAGFPVESPVIAVHSVPPSLELTAMRQVRKAGKPVELQLVSRHPDSDGVAFSLEAPLVAGMTIDKDSGKITWTPPADQKGSIRFGAAVEDTEKTKVTKVFEMSVD
jgi:hypothetical protein